MIQDSCMEFADDATIFLDIYYHWSWPKDMTVNDSLKLIMDFNDHKEIVMNCFIVSEK